MWYLLLNVIILLAGHSIPIAPQFVGGNQNLPNQPFLPQNMPMSYGAPVQGQRGPMQYPPNAQGQWPMQNGITNLGQPPPQPQPPPQLPQYPVQQVAPANTVALPVAPIINRNELPGIGTGRFVK